MGEALDVDVPAGSCGIVGGWLLLPAMNSGKHIFQCHEFAELPPVLLTVLVSSCWTALQHAPCTHTHGLEHHTACGPTQYSACVYHVLQ